MNSKRLQKVALPYNIHCKSCTTTLTRQDAQTVFDFYFQSIKNKCFQGKIIKIQDEMFHITCLKCSVCQRTLGVTPCYPMHAFSSAFRCSDCHREATSPKCHGCKRPTFEKCVSAFDAYWHESCFKCKGCKKPFKSRLSFGLLYTESSCFQDKNTWFMMDVLMMRTATIASS
ncbi:hypothetical protein CRE_20764 [Caenorhabditis remanei]|uniref:LIM zinc-binding domain-containing protein n=1 Tax=Caenorhabditis remanei TaxID=31234 RepID=E3MFF9_CAERE|nr:hypothetical protein CRE_20764 [Caenorhabditis remanei]